MTVIRFNARARQAHFLRVLTACVLSLSLPAHATPSFAEVKAAWRSSEVTYTDRAGEPLQTLRHDSTARRLDWVALHDLSPALIDALLAAEDQRFHAHQGVDWSAVAQSVWDNLSRDRARGASTLTMQLAALLDRDLAIHGERRTPSQKVSQALAARALESQWSKSEILEAYLNLTGFRGELVGVDATSEALFGASARALSRTDAALLASLVRGPNAHHRVVADRACALSRRLAASGIAVENCEALRLRAQQTLGRSYRLPPRLNDAPHFARLVADQQPSSHGTVKTTLVAPIQRVALASVQRHLAEMSSRNMRDAAVIVLDNASGEVLAYVGNGGALSRAPQLDMVRTRRQAGSTLKPLIYAAAFESRLLTAASILDDSPTGFAAAGGLYAPQNYDRDFKGLVTARTALAASLNIPAVKVLDVIGLDRGYSALSRLGLEVDAEAPDFYGYALALGGVDVSLANLTNSYRAMAQAGHHSPWRPVAQTLRSPGRASLSAAAAFIVSDILADPGARALTFGTDSVLATRIWTAVKTGTSKDMRDNWCIGFSEHYTVGVWVGNADGTPMKDVSGVAGAAPIWADVVHALHGDLPSRPPVPPEDVVAQSITFAATGEAPRREWFIRGTETHRVSAAVASAARIVYPTAGLIIALDPDIPKGRERVPIDLSAPAPGSRLKLNGRWLTEPHFQPRVGRHRLELVDAGGRVTQQLTFEVR